MLEALRRGRRWGTAAVVVVVGGVFVFFMASGAPLQCAGTPNAVVAVGDLQYDRYDFLRTRAFLEEYHRSVLGDAFDAAAAEDFLRASTANQLISRAILTREAERLGLAITREELRRAVRAQPGFRDEEGQFDVERFESYAEYEFGTQANYLETLSQELLANKVSGLLGEAAHVSEREAEAAARYQLEEIRLAWIALDPTQSAAPEGLDPAEVELYASTQEPALRERYEAEPTRFEEPEQVRFRHILLRIGADDPELRAEERREEAQKLLERLRAGEAFAPLAESFSEDPSSERGGDMGFVTRGEVDPALDEAVFALQPGELGEVVRSSFGFHVLRVEERREARLRPFEDVREELARERLAAERGSEGARATAESLREQIAGGASLEQAARGLGLTLERTAWLRRRQDGFVPGLGSVPEVLDAAFALTPERPNADRVFEAEGKLVLLQLLERRLPESDILTETARLERQRLLAEERDRLVQDWIEVRRRALEGAGELRVNLAAVDG